MKKYKDQHKKFLLKKSKVARKKKASAKGKNTSQFRAYRRFLKKNKKTSKHWDQQRRKFYLDYYQPIKYTDTTKVVKIDQPIGCENDVNYLAKIGATLMTGLPENVQIDLSECTRVWPSGVMMLCSFKHWTTLTAIDGVQPPKVASTVSKHQEVSAYLDFCGFHNYVKRKASGAPHSYPDASVVKIQRERDGSSFYTRFDEISALIEEHANYTPDELELFKSTVLGEILINATEHGVNYKDMGWYTLVQHHPTSGIISLNIADNGIGIRNSLKTGPQKTLLQPDEDHQYILEAFKPNVSGAFLASTEKKGVFKKSYPKGARRGNGLVRIKESCSALNVPLTMMSGKGYVQFDEKGNCVASQTFPEMIFAGTLYNLKIPTKRDST